MYYPFDCVLNLLKTYFLKKVRFLAFVFCKMEISTQKQVKFTMMSQEVHLFW